MNKFFLTADERQQISENLTAEGRETFSEIVAHYKTDLTANARFRVSPSEQLLVWSEAGSRLRTQVLHKESFDGNALGRAELSEIWHAIVADYHLTRGWKHKLDGADVLPHAALVSATEKSREASEIKADESRAIFREMWPFIWKFVILALLLKIVILYLGGHGYLYWGNS